MIHFSCAQPHSACKRARRLTPEEQQDVTSYNFDHPDAFDQQAMLECIEDLKLGKPVDLPIYDFTKHQRSTESRCA
jgi:uridine kinase